MVMRPPGSSVSMSISPVSPANGHAGRAHNGSGSGSSNHDASASENGASSIVKVGNGVATIEEVPSQLARTEAERDQVMRKLQAFVDTSVMVPPGRLVELLRQVTGPRGRNGPSFMRSPLLILVLSSRIRPWSFSAVTASTTTW
jgi:hypothetical protein